MTKQISEQKPLPTIWRTPNELWEKIEQILAQYDPPKSTGRSRVDQRAVLDAIIFKLRTSCQEVTAQGDRYSAHRQRRVDR